MHEAPRNLKALLNDHGHRTRKELGQHFLTDSRQLQKIANAIHEAAKLADGATLPVIEVGTGPGNLTRLLLEGGLRVLGLELDRSFAPIHTETLAPYLKDGQLQIHYGDALHVPEEIIARFCGESNRYVLAGNIPYQITSPLIFQALRRLGAGNAEPSAIVFLMQEEVAQRAVAKPGCRDYGVLAAKLALQSRVTLLHFVPAGAFRPIPKVDSRVLSIVPRLEADRLPVGRLRPALGLIDRLFQHRRKMVTTVLASESQDRKRLARDFLVSRGLPGTARPEEMEPHLFVELAEALSAMTQAPSGEICEMEPSSSPSSEA